MMKCSSVHPSGYLATSRSFFVEFQMLINQCIYQFYHFFFFFFCVSMQRLCVQLATSHRRCFPVVFGWAIATAAWILSSTPAPAANSNGHSLKFFAVDAVDLSKVLQEEISTISKQCQRLHIFTVTATSITAAEIRRLKMSRRPLPSSWPVASKQKLRCLQQQWEPSINAPVYYLIISVYTAYYTSPDVVVRIPSNTQLRQY